MRTTFGVCKTNGDKIWLGKSGSAYKIVVSQLYNDDIKIGDTFIYEFTQRCSDGQFLGRELETSKKYFFFNFSFPHRMDCYTAV